MMFSLPPSADDDGTTWQIERAWPDRHSGATFEARAGHDGQVRGGRWTPSSGAVLGRFGHDDQLPDLAATARSGWIVVHRPGRRAVVRSADGSNYAKVFRPGRAAAAVAAMQNVEGLASAFLQPRIVAVTRDVVTCTTVPGRSLHDLGADPAAGLEWGRAWHAWRGAWVDSIGSAPADPSLPAHDAFAEAAIVRSWAAKLTNFNPSPASSRLVQVADRVAAGLVAGTTDALRPAHRDLHDKQILWDSTHGSGLIDFDTAANAEPALDLGNLRAHLALRERQGLLSSERHTHAARLIDSVADELHVAPERVNAYEAAAWFRLGCLYAFRPRWAALAAVLRAEICRQPGA
ncbi:phosphotransferase [Cryobacterium sp. Hb1]|uniref:phosphotransferase n=1 Tax=Cryobacterium sp. Hb1 TaxID=1259147 RepID=UPI00106D5BC5|nr:phosphotransferase [Cryobacterium sp. Hb1]TFD67053.1 hypothetical protein E3T38_11865 [Cryobacterium sp. Hb1]